MRRKTRKLVISMLVVTLIFASAGYVLANVVFFGNPIFVVILTTDVSTPSTNYEFIGQTQYWPISGYQSVAKKLLVNQRWWYVSSPQDLCAFRARNVVNNHPDNYASSNLADALPVPNDPLVYYYATYHQAVLKTTSGQTAQAIGYTSPNYGQWATSVNDSYYFNGRLASSVTCQVYNNQ